MGINKSVFILYFFYTTLSILISSNTPISSFIIGLTLMWFLYFVFIFGGSIQKKNTPTLRHGKIKNNYVLLFLSLLTPSLSLYASKFYTGIGFIENIENIMSGVSNYNLYQSFFSQAEIRIFSLKKIPAIFSLFVIKVIVIISYIELFATKNNWRAMTVFPVILSTFSYVYFSISRGTSFEIFEILLLLVFCFFISNRKSISQVLLSKGGVLLVLLSVFSVALYSYNISARYGVNDVDTCTIPKMCLDSNTIFFQVSPSLAKISVKLGGYFSFGIYYIGQLHERFYFSNLNDFSLFLLPGSIYIESEIYPRFLCDGILICGASWAPAVERVIFLFGIIGTVIFISILGFFAVFFEKKFLRGDVYCAGILYFIFIYMISLPVGNFFTMSSSNLLACSFFFVAFLCKSVGLSFMLSSKKLKNGSIQ